MSSGVCTVHVYDESRSCSKDYSCKTDTLLSSMKYFKSYLKDVQPQQNVMISVHCDVQVFEWLLQFAQSSKGGSPPDTHQPVSVTTVMPILIASNFLGMDDLVSLCLKFVAQNLTEVATTSADLAALPTDLLQRLAKVVAEEQLEALHTQCTRTTMDSSDSSPASSDDSGAVAAKKRSTLEQLSGRLYKHKIELLLRELKTTVARCTHCGAMFSLAEKSKLSCPVKDGEQMWAPQGNRQRIQGHEPDPAWRLQDHLAALRAGGSGTQRSDGGADSTAPQQPQASWRDIYWDVWSVVTVLYCNHCMRFFPSQELVTCCYHPEPAIFLASKTVGRYPCCGGHAQRSGMVQLFRGGCCARDHQVVAPAGGAGVTPGDAGALQRVLQVLDVFRHLVVPEASSALNVVEWGGEGGEDEAEEEEEGVGEEDVPGEEGGVGRLARARAWAGIGGPAGPGPSSLVLARSVYTSGGVAAGGRRGGRGAGSRAAGRGAPVLARPQTALAIRSIASLATPRSMMGLGPAGRNMTRSMSDRPASAYLSAGRPSTAAAGMGGVGTQVLDDARQRGLLTRAASARTVGSMSGPVPPVSAIARVASGQVFGGSYRDEDAGMCSPRPAEMLDVLKLAAAARNEAAAAVAAQQQQQAAAARAGPQAAGTTPSGVVTGNPGALVQSSFSATAYMGGNGSAAAAGAAATSMTGAAAASAPPVKIVPLSSLQGSGSVGRSPGGALGNGTMARKLRLELLHEDDVARMDALISHLAACRPTQTRSRQTNLGQPQTKSSGRSGPGQQRTSGAGSPLTGSPTSAGAAGSARSSSTSRMAREVVNGRASVVGNLMGPVNNAGSLGGAGGRPTSAPRMRPPLAPGGQGLSLAAMGMQRTILAQR